MKNDLCTKELDQASLPEGTRTLTAHPRSNGVALAQHVPRRRNGECAPEAFLRSPATVLTSPGTSHSYRVVGRAVQNNHRTARPSIVDPSRRRIRRSGTNATALAERCMGARFKGAGQPAREIRRNSAKVWEIARGSTRAPPWQRARGRETRRDRCACTRLSAALSSGSTASLLFIVVMRLQ